MKIYLITLLSSFAIWSSCGAQKVNTVPDVKVAHSEDEPLPVDNGDYDVNYIMGKFDPAKHPDFVIIPVKYADKEGRYIRKDVWSAYLKMYEAALSDGVKLQIISATRNFDNQKSIWENKWNGKTLLEGNTNATTITDPTQRALRILLYSSMPGTSRHHWGTDIDLNALNNDFFDKGEGKKIYDWLKNNGAKYGFCQTYSAMNSDRTTGYQEERWHWSYTPISIRLTQLAKTRLKDEMISGFMGSEAAIEIEVVEKYVLGISPACTKTP